MKTVKYLVAADPDDVSVYLSSRDFFFAKPGEMVTRGLLVCTNDKKRDECGCGRSLGGIQTMQASTLLVVAEGDLDALRAEFDASPLVADHQERVTSETAWTQLVQPLLQAVASYRVGQVLRVGQTPTNFQLWVA